MAGSNDSASRKPLARTIRRTDAPRLSVRRTFRANEDEDATWQQAAVDERLELSEYLRQCVAIGHSMKQAQRLTRRTTA